MIHSENSKMLFWKETYMGQGSSIVFPSLVVQPPSFLLFAYVLPFFACAKKGTNPPNLPFGTRGKHSRFDAAAVLS